ncbi:hypothetical protein C2E23DRAFT_851491 [Lenzites betulinus]|nr:hypothetical protein C2E23DRAFT_851491 [Lenzites betulinus]
MDTRRAFRASACNVNIPVKAVTLTILARRVPHLFPCQRTKRRPRQPFQPSLLSQEYCPECDNSTEEAEMDPSTMSQTCVLSPDQVTAPVVLSDSNDDPGPSQRAHDSASTAPAPIHPTQGLEPVPPEKGHIKSRTSLRSVHRPPRRDPPTWMPPPPPPPPQSPPSGRRRRDPLAHPAVVKTRMKAAQAAFAAERQRWERDRTTMEADLAREREVGLHEVPNARRDRLREVVAKDECFKFALAMRSSSRPTM